MQKFTQVGISLPNDVLIDVDNCRGPDVSRSQMIRRLVERGMNVNINAESGGDP